MDGLQVPQEGPGELPRERSVPDCPGGQRAAPVSRSLPGSFPQAASPWPPHWRGHESETRVGVGSGRADLALPSSPDGSTGHPITGDEVELDLCGRVCRPAVPLPGAYTSQTQKDPQGPLPSHSLLVAAGTPPPAAGCPCMCEAPGSPLPAPWASPRASRRLRTSPVRLQFLLLHAHSPLLNY